MATYYFGDATANDFDSELSGRQRGDSQVLPTIGAGDLAYGDVFTMTGRSRGGNDTLTSTEGSVFRHASLFGDADYMYRAAHGGDDSLSSTGGYNYLFGDARNMFDRSRGGDDTLTATGTSNLLYGDAEDMFDRSRGGDDILTVTGDSNLLHGDAYEMWGSNVGGNDTLIATGNGNTLFGDSQFMDAASIGGADTFVFGSASGTATVADFRSGDRDMIRSTDAALSWADLDTNGNGVLDNGDAFVSVGNFTNWGDAGVDTAIDLGAAAGGQVGLSVVTVAGVTGLMADDFIFVA